MTVIDRSEALTKDGGTSMPEVHVDGSTAKESPMKLNGLPTMFRRRQQRETICFGTRGGVESWGPVRSIMA